MSSALASAKRKRAPPDTSSSIQPNNRTPNFGQIGEQQVSGSVSVAKAVSILNNRVNAVEIKLKDILGNNLAGGLATSVDSRQVPVVQQGNVPELPSNLTETLTEYENRFDILAEEIANIKNIVLSLQTYTMEVNKMLLEERIRLLSTNDNAIDQEGTLEEILKSHDNHEDLTIDNDTVGSLEKSFGKSSFM